MKVCLLNVEFEINGGTERVVATHAKELRKAGHDVDIACAYYNNVFPESFHDFNIIEYDTSSRNIGLLRRTIVSLKLLKKDVSFLKDYDVIIAYRPFTNIFAMRAKKKYSHLKTLWYCSHPEKHLYPKYFRTLNKKNIFFRLILLPAMNMDKRSINSFDTIWVNSYRMWTKFSFIYNYINHKVLFPPPGKLFKPTNKKGNTLLCISRIEPEKNQLILLKALSKLNEKIHTVFVGRITNKPYFNKLKLFAEKYNLDVSFLGEVKDEDLYNLYNDSFLCVYTPIDEDFGIMPLESMSARKPVLTHISNGVSEVLPKRFVYSTIEDLSQKIYKIYNGEYKPLSLKESKLPSQIYKEHIKEIIKSVENE